MKHRDLTGRWLGRYDYGDGREGVGFEVDLVETGGALSGDVMEPNSFRADLGAELHAVIMGSRDGASVDFVKTYLGFSNEDDPHYAGTANTGLTRISGLWRFAKFQGEQGRFVMMRKPMAAAQAEKTERLEAVK